MVYCHQLFERKFSIILESLYYVLIFCNFTSCIMVYCHHFLLLCINILPSILLFSKSQGVEISQDQNYMKRLLVFVFRVTLSFQTKYWLFFMF